MLLCVNDVLGNIILVSYLTDSLKFFFYLEELNHPVSLQRGQYKLDRHEDCFKAAPINTFTIKGIGQHYWKYAFLPSV